MGSFDHDEQGVFYAGPAGLIAIYLGSLFTGRERESAKNNCIQSFNKFKEELRQVEDIKTRRLDKALLLILVIYTGISQMLWRRKQK